MSMLQLVPMQPGSGAVAGVQLRNGTLLPIGHIIGVGRNYAEHAREQNADVPARPLIFTKSPASVTFHEQDIIIPAICNDADGESLPPERFPQGSQVDYEGELAVIIGTPIRDADARTVLDPAGPVLGVCCANDVSARWWQKHGSAGQYVRGKSFDSFCPLGPHVVPLTDAPPLDAISIETRLNGDIMQRDTTASMMFPVAQLIAELSRGATLLPGTVILTGTPAGVGMARTPPRYLVPGDIVEIDLAGIGVLRNTVSAERCD